MSLPPLYYLQNFRRALASLAERYVDLLSADEAGFIQQFAGLPQPTQCLLARLVTRKGPLFRRATLQYAEVPNMDAALQPLRALGWLDTNPRLSAQELLRQLTRAELHLALGIRVRLPKARTAAAAPVQLELPLEQQTPSRALSEWHPRLAGCLVHLCVEPLVKRLQLLFFGNDHQTWSEFVLADLGLHRYESVPLDASARAFQSREQIEHFYRLNECRARLGAGEPASAVRDAAFVPTGVCDWLRLRFLRLQLRLGALLESEGNVELTLQSYRAAGSAEALISAVRLQERLGMHEDALRDALAAETLACTEAQHEALQRILARLGRRLQRVPAVRRARAQPVTMELELPPLAGRQRVEIAAAEHMSHVDSPVFYVENGLLTSLFGLLCWDALFAPVQGAFFHPFQAAPADLYTAEFRSRRAARFESMLGLLEAGQHEAVIWDHYRTKAGVYTRFVRWSRMKPQLLALALQCIPPLHLKLCFERLLENLQDNASGIPDLVQFWPQERRYRLLEVKAPGDRLQDNQRRWMAFFARHSLPAAVCRVHWQPQ